MSSVSMIQVVKLSRVLPPILGLLCTMCGAATDERSVEITKPRITPGVIREKIEAEGAPTVLGELVKDEGAWNTQILGPISQGKRPWLEIAVLLRPVADAGAGFDLDVTVAEALSTSPETALDVLVPTFPLSILCGNEESVGKQYDGALKIIEIRLEAVSSVKDSRLKSKRDQCLVELRKLEQAVKDNRKTWFSMLGPTRLGPYVLVQRIYGV